MKKRINFTPPHILSGLDKSEPILVALSGGADSTALISLIADYKKEAGCTVIAAHLNHGIRGEEYGFEADRDERFCISLCASLGIEIITKRVNVPALAKKSGRSLEGEAREARYDFFTEIMQNRGIRVLATAHNADDSLETQLFNIGRGCGIDGLCGIPPVRPLDVSSDSVVIRPLIKASKREIIAYCHENGIEYVTDSTNNEDDCVRNEIRHTVIPQMERILPSIRTGAERLALSASEDSDFILSVADEHLAKDGAMRTVSLLSLHVAVMKRVFMLAFAKISDASLESVHLDALHSLLKTQKNGARVSLPDKKQARVEDGRLFFEDEDRETKSAPKGYRSELYEGLNVIDGTPFAVLISTGEEKSEDMPSGYTVYSSAALNTSLPLTAKSRGEGDTVRDGGMSKRIKKLMCDKKVPLADRPLLPILYSCEDAVYVPLCAVSDQARPQKNKKVINITILKRSSEA